MPMTAKRSVMGELLEAQTTLKRQQLKLRLVHRDLSDRHVSEIRLSEAGKTVLSYKVSSFVKRGISQGIVEHRLSGGGVKHAVTIQLDRSGRTGTFTAQKGREAPIEGRVDANVATPQRVPDDLRISHSLTEDQKARLKPFADLLYNEVLLTDGFIALQDNGGGGVNPDECIGGCQLAKIACTLACCGIVGGGTLGVGCLLCWAGCRLALRRCNASCRKGNLFGGGGGIIIV